jgi:hypothetical protein
VRSNQSALEKRPQYNYKKKWSEPARHGKLCATTIILNPARTHGTRQGPACTPGIGWRDLVSPGPLLFGILPEELQTVMHEY